MDNFTSFKYKSGFFKQITSADNGVFRDVKIAVPLKYLSTFWRSLDMLLINCKIHFELNWSSNCVMSAIADNIQNNKHKLIRPNCYSIRQRQCKTGKTIRRRN